MKPQLYPPDMITRTIWRAFMNHWYGDLEPGVKIGSSKEKLAINAAVTVFIDGIPQSVLTAQDEDFDTDHTSLAAEEKCRLLVCCDGSQNIKTIQGPIVADSVSDANTVLPAVPADHVVLGDILVETTTSETFVFGTTELDANGTNGVYRDLIWVDSGPDAIDVTGA